MTLSLCSHRMLQANYLLYTAVTLDLSFQHEIGIYFPSHFFLPTPHLVVLSGVTKSTVERPNTLMDFQKHPVSVCFVFFFMLGHLFSLNN